MNIFNVLKAIPTIMIPLAGYTDSRASISCNRELGFRRSRSARNYLMRQGIGSERMTVRSQGETQRTSPNNQIIDYARSDLQIENR
jgi:outer membrane protein OmpA-like peptidoglycan-associated protein